MKRITFLIIFILFTLVCCNKQQTEDINLQWSEKAPNEMSWDDAVNYCANLNEDGLNDWKLPNIDELRTLIQAPNTITGGSCKISEKSGSFSIKDKTADCTESSNKLGDKGYFWSSSTISDYPDTAWIVHFVNGQVRRNIKAGDTLEVRCVREKTDKKIEPKQPKKTESLQWSEKSPKEMNHDEAVNYCKNLNEGGHKDWRLPNIDELRTLIKDRKTVTGGKCKVSEKDACLSVEQCFNAEDCAEGCEPYTEPGDLTATWICKDECVEIKTKCVFEEGCYRPPLHCDYTSSKGKYSKLGDTETFISSSIATSPEYGDLQIFWRVNFNTGRVTDGDEYGVKVRCVRDSHDKTEIKAEEERQEEIRKKNAVPQNLESIAKYLNLYGESKTNYAEKCPEQIQNLASALSERMTYEELLKIINKEPSDLDGKHYTKVSDIASPQSVAKQKQAHKDYVPILVNDKTVKKGLEFFDEYRDTILRAYKQTGVKPEDILGVLNWESKFGEYKGTFSVYRFSWDKSAICRK